VPTYTPLRGVVGKKGLPPPLDSPASPLCIFRVAQTAEERPKGGLTAPP
jgi:hypothetical protein